MTDATREHTGLARLREMHEKAYRIPWDRQWTADCGIDQEDADLILALRHATPKLIELIEAVEASPHDVTRCVFAKDGRLEDCRCPKAEATALLSELEGKTE